MGSREPLANCPVCGHLPGDGSANSGRYWRYCSRLGHDISTPWMDSREGAAVAWNDLVRQYTEGKPRIPLPGWCDAEARSLRSVSGINMVALPSGFWSAELRLSDVARSFGTGSLPDARIAAEDAARAMVADMAKALGGSVTWGESEVSDGNA